MGFMFSDIKIKLFICYCVILNCIKRNLVLITLKEKESGEIGVAEIRLNDSSY